MRCLVSARNGEKMKAADSLISAKTSASGICAKLGFAKASHFAPLGGILGGGGQVKCMSPLEGLSSAQFTVPAPELREGRMYQNRSHGDIFG